MLQLSNLIIKEIYDVARLILVAWPCATRVAYSEAIVMIILHEKFDFSPRRMQNSIHLTFICVLL